MRLFLTGATGFVGLNLLLEALASRRYTEIVAPVRDTGKLRRQLAEEGFAALPAELRIADWSYSAPMEIDHAIHCAGLLFARERDDYFRVNVDESLRHLTSLPASARTLVLSSQSAAGPTPGDRTLRTNADPDTPLTWYGESKLAMEKALRTDRPEAWIWRPPMILGPRDRATLPLFQMACGPLRIKPGRRPKSYSWIAVRDLVRSIFTALSGEEWRPAPPLFVCAPNPITDVELIETAAQVVEGRGVNLAVPHFLLRGAAPLIDRVPALRAAAPSLTRDRVREIFPDRWVVDGAEFRARFAPGPFATLHETLAETHAWYLRAGLLPARAA